MESAVMKNDKLDELISMMLQNLSPADKVKLRGTDAAMFAADSDPISPDFEQKLFERIDRYEAEKAAAAAELEPKKPQKNELRAAAFLYLRKKE
jgi:hypothetical protein